MEDDFDGGSRAEGRTFCPEEIDRDFTYVCLSFLDGTKDITDVNVKGISTLYSEIRQHRQQCLNGRETFFTTTIMQISTFRQRNGNRLLISPQTMGI